MDTVFLMPNEQLTFISASLVKEIAYWDGDLSSFVPAHVAKALRKKYEDNGKVLIICQILNYVGLFRVLRYYFC
ncbi:MAG: hypothetical protein U5J63_06315 [Fodinibius sp.]|nr:hypothetical protein [Fodinibius sp.]